MKRLVSIFALAFVAAAACSDESDAEVPDAVASPSRHAALRDALTLDAKAYGFAGGDWLEDLGDAPFYGLAWLARRQGLEADETSRRTESLARARALMAGSLLEGDVQDKVMAALGMIEHVAASGDRSDVPAIDDFVDRLDSLTHTLGDYLDVGEERSWAIRIYGPTTVTALVGLVDAQYALLVGGERAEERIERAIAIDAKIRERAFGELSETFTKKQARGYAIAPGRPDLDLYPNVAMIMLKARLFRLTKREEFRLEARALYGAIQPLKLSDAPARYASPYAAASLKLSTRDISTLSSQNYLTLALLLLFEITGDARFVDEADRVLDGIEKMRGSWCASAVYDPGACQTKCSAGQACISESCTEDRCTTGILHHVVDGRLAEPQDGTLFCSGCNLQTLYVVGYRRALAHEPY